MTKKQLVTGDRYVVRHNGAPTVMKFKGLHEIDASHYRNYYNDRPLYNAKTYMMFENMNTGRTVEIKSMLKVIGAIVNGMVVKL